MMNCYKWFSAWLKCHYKQDGIIKCIIEWPFSQDMAQLNLFYLPKLENIHILFVEKSKVLE